MKRTDKQNRTLHKFCELLASELNEAGLDQRLVLKESIPIPWDKLSVKEQLWRPIQEAVVKKSSTADADTKDYNEVHAVLMRHLGDKFGVYVEFPTREQK